MDNTLEAQPCEAVTRAEGQAQLGLRLHALGKTNCVPHSAGAAAEACVIEYRQKEILPVQYATLATLVPKARVGLQAWGSAALEPTEVAAGIVSNDRFTRM